MEHLSEITLLSVIAVNIVSIILFCILDTKITKHNTKKILIAGICLLSFVLIFAFVCMLGFINYGVAKNGAVFVLFVPLAGYFLYETIKELKEAAR